MRALDGRPNHRWAVYGHGLVLAVVVAAAMVTFASASPAPGQAGARAPSRSATAMTAYDPVPDPAAVVWCDSHARFTVLTTILFRAEYLPAGVAPEDRASFAFINRKLPVPWFTVANTTSWCNITVSSAARNDSLVITYAHGSGSGNGSASAPFHGRLSAATAAGTVWVDGAGVPSSTLGGTPFDLKGCDGPVPLTCSNTRTDNPLCTNGVLSRSGWSSFNDGENNVFLEPGSPEAQSSGRDWARSVHSDKTGQDLYVFMYDTDFKGALGSLAAVSGKMAVPPRRFFGVWWSKWEKYTQNGLEQIIDRYAENGIPLDGINLDTEWHVNDAGYLDAPDDRLYSGAFDWDTTLYPDPAKMVEYMTARGLWPVYFDIHQSAGVLSSNSRWAEFTAAIGQPHRRDKVPCTIDNATFTAAFFQLLKHQVGGSNYWWLDFGVPQVGTLSPLANFNQVLWDRHIFFNDSRQVGRPSIMGGSAGLGTHRYPFVHSGDLYTAWATLKFLPAYTSAAANTLVSFITHDIGGHRMPPSNPDSGKAPNDGNDPELYTRWVQYGAWSAQLRPHPQKFAQNFPDVGINERRIWEYPYGNFAAMRSAMQRRSILVPYIYTAALDAYQTDVPFMRALYVDYPTDNTVYDPEFQNQYMFGSSVAVAPITDPMELPGNISKLRVYLPANTGTAAAAVVWVNLDTGSCVPSNTVLNQTFTLQEYPAYVRAGSIIPATLRPGCLRPAGRLADATCELSPPLIGAAGVLPAALQWMVVLGNATAGWGRLLEDVGDSDAYSNATLAGGSAAITETVAEYRASPEWVNVTISAATEPCQGFPAIRTHVVVIRGVLAPAGATALVTTTAGGAGTPIPVNATWSWDAKSLTAEIVVRGVPTGDAVSISVAMQHTPFDNALCGALGFAGTQARLVRVKKMIDLEGPHTLPSRVLNRVEETAVRMQEDPAAALSELQTYSRRVRAALLLHLTAGTGAPSATLKGLISAWFADVLE